ncbi:MAG: haloalkane dehalogenase [Chloroflexi bacterium]|uniref:Haloalkane dehalogenase n=1 Tax=Candidatus Chlorohelix allophototropha TaxID=3003348 RepID=A0A8T7M403_9CHLR|nr:haloalkane dehalogenase [Chloroflexota bacterium]WJW70201.1 haloalkane dehalogenase [Chloroflexota bacterium L227-S17]
MEYLRTPDERFENLPGYPFAPHYVEVGGLRMHYVAEGAPEAETVLLLHGEPSWSYLYRKMIPLFVEAGYRVIAPDLIGFGRSDKPTERADYTYQRHVDWVKSLIEQLDLKNITLVGQDWGGLIGLRVAAEEEKRFARIVTANTFLPTGDEPPNEAFLRWRRFSQEAPTFDAGRVVKGACATALTTEVIQAYNAPFPDERYQAGARQFPALVPITPDDPASMPNRKAWEVLEKWDKPFLTAFGDSDPITRGGDRYFQKKVPGAQNQPHITLSEAAHFLQEDKGEELAQVIIAFMRGSQAN